MSTRVLILATRNAGKAEEVRRLLPSLTVETLEDHPGVVMPPEEHDTFRENARVKAEHVAAILRLPVLADDSGLAVDALGGAPGVHSARYAEGSDAVRIERLLEALARVPQGNRRARFVAAVAFAVPDEPAIVVEGECDGRIAEAPRGMGGFGYDPIFLVGEGPLTMAELPVDEKNVVSHRGRALGLIRPVLERYFSLE